MNKMLTARSALIVVSMLVLVGTALYGAPIPRTINYQGYLKDAAGKPVTGPVNLTFTLYSSASGVGPVWTESHPGVPLANGVYSATLGETNSFGDAPDRQLWVGVQVEGGPLLLPVAPFSTVPFAMRAGVADRVTLIDGSTIAAGAISADKIAAGAVSADKLSQQYVRISGDAMTGPLSISASGYTLNPASTGAGPALYSISSGTGNAGTFGVLNDLSAASAVSAVTTGTGRAGYFVTTNPASTLPALYGGSSSSVGVQGHSAGGTGVWGSSIAASGIGVDGLSDAVGGVGVKGRSANGYGVQGISTGNVGVRGSSTSSVGIQGSSGADTGVWGVSGGATGVGVDGLSDAVGGIGVKGRSAGGIGVRGIGASYGGYFTASGGGSSYGIYAVGGKNYLGGSVGLGTTTPGARVHLKGAGFPDSFMYMDTTAAGQDTGLRFYENGTVSSHLFWNALTQNLKLYGKGYSGVDITSTGNVGVGTQSPSEKLHVAGRYIRVEGAGGEQAYLGGDGAGSDVQIGSLNAGVTNVALYNPTSKTYMTVYLRDVHVMGGADIAEPFESIDANRLKPGMVMVIDPENPGQLVLAEKAYDTKVAGIISGANGIRPGMTMTQDGLAATGGVPVALTGRVYAWSDASYGAIDPGDLLTTSATPGHAMKVADHGRAQGAIIGKAMSRLTEGTGLVLVLVTLQ